MYPHERVTLRRIAERLQGRLPGRIVAAYAFGSRVRGSHHAWPDFDLLVVIRGKEPHIESEIVSLIVDEEGKSGLSLPPVIQDVRAFEGSPVRPS